LEEVYWENVAAAKGKKAGGQSPVEKA